MHSVEPEIHQGGELRILAEHQPPYDPLPASVDPEGVVMTEWEPSASELECLLQGGRVRLWTWTFNQPFHPVNLETVAPACGLRGAHG